jgi:hypothetical protein
VVSSARHRYQARFTFHASAETLAERVPPTSGVIEAVDDHTCILHTGSNNLDALAIHVAVLGIDFQAHEPPELLDHIRTLAERLGRATPAPPSAPPPAADQGEPIRRWPGRTQISGTRSPRPAKPTMRSSVAM